MKQQAKTWQVGIDIGGTFTDVVAVARAGNEISGELRSAKVATRPGDRVAGLKAALAAVDLDWIEVGDLIHGTTMVTNAIVEDDLAPVTLITTEGFADTLAIGRQNRRELYHLDVPPKLAPQVPADRRLEVAERLDSGGAVLKPLDQKSARDLIGKIDPASAVAVCLLHSYANPDHEERLAALLANRFPFVAISSRVNPEAREFERMATTVLSASVMPLTRTYLDNLEAEKPPRSRLHLFHSCGGMASPDAIRDLPLGLALSGPAAGVAAASRMAREQELSSAISFDMGGTTTDVCLIRDGRAEISSDRSIAGRPLRQPMVAVESIGAGGGSIARLDHGALRVGPQSAGAQPGPACYGRGGLQPTVSDANLILGYLDAGRVLGDDLTLDIEAARRAVAPLARGMNMSIPEAALGIVRVADATMIRALARISVERGIDGRAATLLAFGGAGPMHGVGVARGFGISRVLVPDHSGAFSAFGCISAEMSYSRQRTIRMAAENWDQRRIDQVRGALRQSLEAPLRAAGIPEKDIVGEEVASIRYSGQSYALEVGEPDFSNPDELGAKFFRLHDEQYGFATRESWELVAVRLKLSGPRGLEISAKEAISDDPPAGNKSTLCTFAGAGQVEAPRISRTALSAGEKIPGPAIVEDAWSTIVIPPGASLCKTDRGLLDIAVGEAP